MSIMDRIFSQNVDKGTEDLNNTLNQMDLRNRQDYSPNHNGVKLEINDSK